MRRFFESIAVAMLAAVCVLAFAELFLRHVTGIFSTYSEKSGESGYMSPFIPFTGTRNLQYPPGSIIKDVRKEFEYTYEANELGFFDRGPGKKESHKLRILCIGDSFTHGIGAPHDSSWPRGLESHLQQLGVEVEVINAGLQGSDPIYSMDFLERLLFEAYEPDLVLLAINTTDLYEVALRGGPERFLDDSTVQYQSPPWWEPLFAKSHLARGIVHSLGYNGYLLRNTDMPNIEEASIATIRDRLKEWVKKSEEDGRNVKFGIVIHPLIGELSEDGEFLISDAFEAHRNEWLTINVAKGFAEDGRLTATTASRFFWPIDQHHNSAGYWLFGELVAKALVDLLPAKEKGFTNSESFP